MIPYGRQRLKPGQALAAVTSVFHYEVEIFERAPREFAVFWRVPLACPVAHVDAICSKIAEEFSTTNCCVVPKTGSIVHRLRSSARCECAGVKSADGGSQQQHATPMMRLFDADCLCQSATRDV